LKEAVRRECEETRGREKKCPNWIRHRFTAPLEDDRSARTSNLPKGDLGGFGSVEP